MYRGVWNNLHFQYAISSKQGCFRYLFGAVYPSVNISSFYYHLPVSSFCFGFVLFS